MKMDKNVVLFVVILAFLKGFESSPCRLPKQKLLIDHDGGADDAIAIFLSLLYEKYFDGPEVVALTTTYGNVNESQVFTNSQRFLDLLNRRDVPIYRGATKSLLVQVESDYFFGYDGLGDNDDLASYQAIVAEQQHAAIGLIELSKKYEGQLIVMAIGPQTNIALAQRLDPGFIGRLAKLYVGAGHVYSDKFQTAEFNAEMDVEAYRIVTDEALVDKVTLVPFSQIKLSLNITKDWRENVFGAIQTDVVKELNKYERESLAKSKSWVLLDPAVAAVMLDRNDIVEKFKTSNNSIHVCGTNRGINTNAFDSESPNVRLMYSAIEDNYKKLLVDVFSAQLGA